MISFILDGFDVPEFVGKQPWKLERFSCHVWETEFLPEIGRLIQVRDMIARMICHLVHRDQVVQCSLNFSPIFSPASPPQTASATLLLCWLGGKQMVFCQNASSDLRIAVERPVSSKDTPTQGWSKRGFHWQWWHILCLWMNWNIYWVDSFTCFFGWSHHWYKGD